MATQTIPKIDMQPRDRVGSRYANRLRKAGQLPAVIYGHKQETLHVAVDAKEITDLLHENHQLLEVAISGKAEPCLIKALQWDHLGDKITHIDLTRVDLSETVEVDVTLELTGEPPALAEAGAILDRPTPTILVSCRADSIPDKIVHDISALTVEQPCTIADLALPEGVSAAIDSETVIAQIQIMAEVPDEEETVEAVADEPQVVGRADEKEGGDQPEGKDKE